MGKNRVIYQSQAVYAGPKKISDAYTMETGNNMPTQLQRIQNANYNFELSRQDVNQFGNLAAIDRVILESPTVGLDTSWYVANFHNEDKVGFKINQNKELAVLDSCITDIIERVEDERNYYVRVVKEGSDAVDFSDTADANNDVIGIGNGFLSSYSTEAAIGGFPTASLTIEGLNIAFDAGAYENFLPSVDPADGTKEGTLQYTLPLATENAGTDTTSVLKPGDIVMNVPNTIGAGTDLKVQNYTITLDLGREPLQKLGSRFAYAREIAFPVTVTMSVDALVGDLAASNLADIINSDSDYDVVVELKKGSAAHIAYILKDAKLDSQDYTNTIGDNKSVTLNFSTQIGSAAQDDVGLFMSGKVGAA